MNEIDRFDKQRKKVKILGASDTQLPANPRILDRKAKTEPVDPEVRVHPEEILDTDNKIRIEARPVDAPQVRIRAADQKSWGKIKRLEDD